MSETIQRRKLYQEVADRLERAILSGDLQVGDPLPSERMLMERFGVGRPAVREALLALERAGLIAITSGERARVIRPTPAGMVAGLNAAVRHWLGEPAGVKHLQDARKLLEVGLAREAAELAEPADIERLKLALAQNRSARAHLAEFERSDVAFHYVIAETARNPIFTAVFQAMTAWLTEQRTTTLRLPGAAEQAYASHARIYEAIAAHDPDAAGREMRKHLEEVADLYHRSLQTESAT
jgi:DNA-binding FadR family transcriptional regulator